MKKIKPLWAFVWACVLFCLIVLSHASDFYTFADRISIAIGTQTDPSNPFTAPITLRNESALDIHKVEFSYVINHLKDRSEHEFLSGDPTFSWGTNIPPIEKIAAGEPTTVYMPFGFFPESGYDAPLIFAEVRIQVKYRPSFRWGRKVVTFKFIGTRPSINEPMVWSPRATSEHVFVYPKVTTPQAPRYAGELLPASDPMPPVPGPSLPTNVMAFFLGRSVSVVGDFPHTVIAYHDRPVLTIFTNNRGLAVSAQFFDREGKIVAVLETNRFVVNQQKAFRLETPDKSSLKVWDQEDRVVLNVRFLNPNAIRLGGRLRYPSGTEVLIDEKDGPFSNSVMTLGNFIDYNVR